MPIIFLIVGVIFAFIGASMARSRNRNTAVWAFVCFFTGLIGVIILAIAGRAENPVVVLAPSNSYPDGNVDVSRPALMSARTAAAAKPYDEKKWNALAEVDGDIQAAVDTIRSYGEKYVDQFAEKYMTIGDKAYLASIRDKVLADARREQEDLNSRVLSTANEVASSYVEWIGRNNGVDPVHKRTVHSVLPYEGATEQYKGGIKVLFTDGSVLLRNKSGGKLFRNEAEADTA